MKMIPFILTILILFPAMIWANSTTTVTTTTTHNADAPANEPQPPLGDIAPELRADIRDESETGVVPSENAAPVNESSTPTSPLPVEAISVQTKDSSPEKTFPPLQLTVGFDHSSPNIQEEMEEISVNGINLGMGLEYKISDAFSTTTRQSFSYISGSDKRFIGSSSDHKINNKIIKIGQSFNYNIEGGGMIFQPFVEGAIGYGWWKSEVTPQTGGKINLTGNDPLLEAALGMNLKLANGFMPFFRVAIRDFDIEDYVEESGGTATTQKFSDNEKYDFGGVNYIVGAGYAF